MAAVRQTVVTIAQADFAERNRTPWKVPLLPAVCLARVPFAVPAGGDHNGRRRPGWRNSGDAGRTTRRVGGVTKAGSPVDVTLSSLESLASAIEDSAGDAFEVPRPLEGNSASGRWIR